jgi:hypothetical protein
MKCPILIFLNGIISPSHLMFDSEDGSIPYFFIWLEESERGMDEVTLTVSYRP